MKTHTNTFKENIKKLGRELDSQITYTLNNEEIVLGKEQLNAITPHYEGDILKSVMKQLDIDSNVEIPVGTEVNYQFGVKVGNDYEYLDFGNYIVYSTEKQEDTRSYKIVCYDKMLYAMKNYERLDIEYPITLKNYLSALCTKIGLTLNDTNFVNYDKEITNELYLDSEGNSLDYTYRDVLDEIAGATASTICINDDDELEVRYINQTKGDNLFDISLWSDVGLTVGSGSGTVEVNNNSITIDNTGGKDIYTTSGMSVNNQTIPSSQRKYLIEVEPSTTYTISFVKTSDDFSSAGSDSCYYSLEDENYIVKSYGNLGNLGFNRVVSKTITTSSDTKYLSIRFGTRVAVGEITYSNIMVVEGDNTEYQPYGDTIDEEYLKDINVNFGEKYGPVNSVVFSRSAESDNIYRQDETSVEQDGLCEIKIKDNQILNSNNRDEFIDEVFNQLNGFEYYANDYSSTGIAYYDLCDRYNVKVDNNIYSCIMMNDELDVSQGLEEKVHLDIPEKSETDYKKADKTDRKVNETWIIANKQEGYIEALTSRTTSLEENTYTITQVNDLIQNAESGITNTFTEAGGNNIFRNTGLWFENSGEDSEQNPYEFWTGVVVRVKEENASNMNALLLQNTTLSQNQNVANGYYTISFKYKKPIQLANASVIINGNEYELTETDETEFTQTIEVKTQYIDVDFICDVDGGCEIYDLMVNLGQTKLAYSQNQNETTTDTVNISKGITITSSDLDVKFKADADGIRILDSSDNITTNFTDVGMTTGEATINGKSKIVGTLWQEVNGQTWITRL